MNKIFVCTFVLGLLFSCNHNIRINYYDTGELRTVIVVDCKDTLDCVKSYYKNGQLSFEGYISKDGKVCGFAKEYYSDGELKWAGHHENFHRIYSVDYDTVSVIISSLADGIEVNKPFKFRVIANGVHPNDYEVTKDCYGFFVEKGDIMNDDYPYTLTLTEEELKEFDSIENRIHTKFPIGIHFYPTDRYKNGGGTYYLQDLPAKCIGVTIIR